MSAGCRALAERARLTFDVSLRTQCDLTVTPVDARGSHSAFVMRQPKSTAAIIVELNRVLRSEPTHYVRAAEPRKALH